MSQLSCQHEQEGENKRLTMNQSEAETTPSEWLIRAEGRQRSKTLTFTLRVEDDAPVAKEYKY